MKKKALILVTLIFTLVYAPVAANVPESDPEKTTAVKEEEAAKAKMLINRLEEIKAMDKSQLTKAERKELREEVRSIKQQLRTTGNGIYLSIGAIIIIILLLILLL